MTDPAMTARFRGVLRDQLAQLRIEGARGARRRASSVKTRGPDLEGQRFGRLTVTAPAYVPSSASRKWSCACDCGNHVIVPGHALTAGNTQSCGCYRRDRISETHRTHGMSRTSIWNTWSSMKDRCTNPNDHAYPRYGGRGITVCPEWMDSFEAFYAHVGDRPTQGHSLDRVDNDRGYEPGNVRWATAKEQANNRRPPRSRA